MPRTIKRQQNLLYEFDYNPESLIARLKKELNARSISALARAIAVTPSVLSKVRRHELTVSSNLLIAIHDATSIPIRELRAWMGDHRRLYDKIKRKRFKRETIG